MDEDTVELRDGRFRIRVQSAGDGPPLVALHGCKWIFVSYQSLARPDCGSAKSAFATCGGGCVLYTTAPVVGANPFHVQATDVAGNVGTGTNTFTLLPPQACVFNDLTGWTTSEQGGSSTGKGTVAVEGDLADAGHGAVLAETDVINMVSRGITTADILRGVHESMAERFARLLRSLTFDGPVFVSGGLASDVGMIGALRDALARKAAQDGLAREVVTHEDAIFAGAIGAALWGGFRYRKLGQAAAWTADTAEAVA